MKYFAYRPNYPSKSVEVEVDDSSRLGRGATATVYKAKFRNKLIAAKIFAPEKKPNIEKISAMISLDPDYVRIDGDGKKHAQLAWPSGLLKDSDDVVRGFMMPLLDSKKSLSIDHFYDLTLADKHSRKSELALSFKVEIARNLSNIIHSLHSDGHHLIDIKPQNILVQKNTHFVSILDCDGFSVKTNKTRMAAELMSTDYISPEAYQKKLLPSELGKQQDLYALAVILFQLLNNGTHPFQGILQTDLNVGSTNDEKAAAGLYPHATSPNPLIKPRKQSVHHLWDSKTVRLFERAFSNPDYSGSGRMNRPTAKVWRDHFDGILNNQGIHMCRDVPNDPRHMSFGENKCPTCYLEGIGKERSNVHVSSQRTRREFTARGAPVQSAPIQSSSQANMGGWFVWGAIAAILIILAAAS